MRTILMAGAVAILANTGAAASVTPHPQAEAQALDLAEKAIALRSVIGPANKTPQVAALYKAALVSGGFADADVTITPVDDGVDHTAYLIACWPGSDPSLKPIVISGHMDVVEAKPSDWQRDPFTPVVENGYLFGRGATDMKLDGTLAIASLVELKREGYKPRRSIIIEFSGDEETRMMTSAMIAERLANAELVLNIDGGGGTNSEATGAPLYFTWQGAEKTYADFQLTVTNPGGHSSEPRVINRAGITRSANAPRSIHATNQTHPCRPWPPHPAPQPRSGRGGNARVSVYRVVMLLTGVVLSEGECHVLCQTLLGCHEPELRSGRAAALHTTAHTP